MSPPETPAPVSAGMIDMESNTTLVQCFPAHQAAPGGDGSFPGVVVLHDRFGLTAHIRHVGNRLAHAGFYSLAPDFYCSPSTFSGAAPDLLHSAKPTHFAYSDETAARDRYATLADERGLAILEQAITYAGGRSKARSGGVRLLGFGTGARLAFLGACTFPESILAVSAFFPPDLSVAKPAGAGRAAPLDMAGALAAPLLLFFGQLDMEIRAAEREVVRKRLADLGKSFRIELFHEAGHDFFCEERDTYRIRASKVAWNDSLVLFRDGALPAESA